MIHLTKEEKANRYDSLQTAFEFYRDHYERVVKEAEHASNNPYPLGAYNKGLAEGYKHFIEDLERWME